MSPTTGAVPQAIAIHTHLPVDFTLDWSTDNYGVMGNPVAHSKSPQIHLAFAAQCGQRLHYQAILVEPSGFAQALDEFQRQGGKGLNVTVPFKSDAYSAASKRTERAERAGAVNTIWFGEAGERHGDTTDGIGLIRDLRHNGVTLKNRQLLIIGAGGAVRGVLGDVIDERPQRIVLVNRTIERARELPRRFADAPCELVVSRFSDLTGLRFDLILNGTSLSLQGELPPLPDGILVEGACCYDMVYGDNDTPFVGWGREHGAAAALDGLGMLVEQAAESFYIWRGVRPETEPVIRMLRAGAEK